MDLELLKRKKYIFTFYKILFFIKVLLFIATTLWALTFIVILFEPFLPAFQLGRQGALLLLFTARENFLINLVVFLSLLILTVCAFFISAKYRKQNKGVIDYWNLGAY